MPKTIAELMFKGALLEGEVGIEVEVEGRNIPPAIPHGNAAEKKGAPRYWKREADGSLRGESAEYVLNNPIRREEVEPALRQLYSSFEACKTSLTDSGRAGVHVHINVRDLTQDQVFSFIMLYLVFENILVRFCGPDREGNLFCLRVQDAEYLMCLIRKGIKEDTLNIFSTDAIRYASINLCALSKYGSLEFRALRSPVEEQTINLWTQLLLCIKDASKEFLEPSDIVLGVSAAGGYDFARQVFGGLIDELPCEDWGKVVMRGMRVIQPLAIAYRDGAEARREAQRLIEERMANLVGVREDLPIHTEHFRRAAARASLPVWGEPYAIVS